MDNKRILVLANSIKKGGRCVAGREVTLGATLEIGAWCRPISDESEGELRPKDMTLTGGSALQPLQIIDVPVKAHVGDPVHPEDWVVTGDSWTLLETCSPQTLSALVERPASLWLETGKPTDHVTPSFLQKSPSHQSLYLVRPEAFRLRYWREHNPFKGYTQKKTRALFRYQGTAYDMSFTDPLATDLYCKDFPDKDKPPKEITLPFGDQCVICVSLTPAFKGDHYKVVATILALP